ncbi:MAG: tellurite resistance TerB family protein [Hyphomonas sp.]
MSLQSLLSEFLLRKADDQPAPVLDVRFEPVLPSRILDAGEPHPEGTLLEESPDAEGQSFVICYVNAEGVKSLRRITVWALKRTPESRILLHARCAETREMMSFRADRIKYCMDMNGDLFEPPAAFLAGIFGLDVPDALLLASTSMAPSGVWPPPDQAYCLLRHQLRNELTLLAAMAESDGQVSRTETDAITGYVRHRAELLGIELDDPRMQKLQGLVRRLRPTGDQIRAAIDEVASRSPKAQLEIVLACQDIMMADGQVHAEELGLLDQIRTELSGA